MRSIASALLALAACNQVFGSHEVQQAPAQIFDAPIDAPFACPAIGTTPMFSPLVHQLLFDVCDYYAPTATRTIASCQLPIGSWQVVEGGAAGKFSAAPGVPVTPAAPQPRMSGDGLTLLVGSPASVTEFRHDTDTWTFITSAALPGGRTFSTIGADHVLLADEPDHQLVELEHAYPSWTMVGTHAYADLGLTDPPIGMSLTSDGLRLVIATDTQAFYTDRPDIASPFRRVDKIDAPATRDVFMTDDCARIYLSGLGSVFYAQLR